MRRGNGKNDGHIDLQNDLRQDDRGRQDLERELPAGEAGMKLRRLWALCLAAR